MLRSTANTRVKSRDQVRRTGSALPANAMKPFFTLGRGTVDFVLTFRTVHNWMKVGKADAMFQTFFKALKPGGILGLEEYRAALSQKQEPKVPESLTTKDGRVSVAEKAVQNRRNGMPGLRRESPSRKWGDRH